MRKKRTQKKISIMLCNIRSAQNAGSILRTADAIGINEVIFGGYTPSPIDRFGRVRGDFVKASLGAEKNMLWRSTPNCVKELIKLKKQGAATIAVEQHTKSVDYKKVKLKTGNLVIIFGNEVSGLSPKLLSLADSIIEIPMKGKKESLNVSVSAGIVLYRLFDNT